MPPAGVILSSKEISEINEQLHFTHLPGYALFLLQHKLDEFSKEQLRVSRQIKLPLLKYFESFSEQQLLAIGREGNREILLALGNNKTREFIENSVQRWMNNHIPQVSKNAVSLEDITMVSFMRRCTFRNMLHFYTADIFKATQILEELDRFTVEIDNICLNRLTAMQQNLYKQAQQLAHIGNWVWDLPTKKLTWSDEMYRIYELAPQSELAYAIVESMNHPEDIAVVDKMIRNIVDTQLPHDFQYRIIMPDGRLKYLHSKAEIRLNSIGEAIEMFGTLQDVTEQKNTEQLLSQHKELIEKIASLAPLLITVYNIHTGKFIFVNRAMQTLLGYEEAQAFEKGTSFLKELIHPDDFQGVREKNLQAVEQANALPAGSIEPVAEFQYRIRHKTGGYRWFRTYRTVFNRDGNNRAELFLSISADITEEHDLHEQVEKEKAFAEMITELSINRIQAFDTSFRYIIWNRQCELYYGKTKAEVLGKTGVEVFPNSKNSVLFTYFERALKGEHIHLKEQEFTFSPGWGEMFFSPLKNGKATFGAMCIVHDITELKNAGNELKQVNLAFEHAEEIAAMGHWQWNVKTNELTFSDNQYKILGSLPFSFKPTIKKFLYYVHPDDKTIIAAKEGTVLKNTEFPGVLFRIIREDGSLRYFHAISKSFTNARGEIVLTSVNRDITEQHLLNLLLQKQNKELKKKNAELESFNYIASHDLQEPLRKIQTFGALILDKKAKGDYNEFENYLGRMNGAIKHLRQLFDDLLAFSRIQHLSESYEEVQLNDAISEVVDSLTVSVSETNAVIEVGALPIVRAIPFQLRQVLQNLISNAIKYHREGAVPIIKITAQKIRGCEIKLEDAVPDKDYVQISVADNGIGFKAEYVSKIFEPFQRLHGKSEYPGTGIGLAICKKILDNHNGFITAQSEENTGSTFTVFLPAV